MTQVLDNAHATCEGGGPASTIATAPSPELAGVGRRGIQFVLDCWSIAIVSGASLALFLFLPINDDGSVEGGGTVIAVLLMVAVVSGGTMFVRMLRLAVDVGITPVIGWIAIAVNAKKQRFDDMAANTIVVRVD